MKAIAFDCDGVVLDSFRNVHLGYLALAKALGVYCPPDLNGFRNEYLKQGTWEEFLAAMGIKKEDFRRADQIFKEVYGQNKSLPFPGIHETLGKLARDYSLFLVTSGHDKEVRRLFVEYNLHNFFKEIRGNLNVGTYAGKTSSLIDILTRYDLSGDQLGMVGDRAQDFIESRAAGLSKVILVEYGWGYDPVKIPDYNLRTKVNEPLEIINAVNELEVGK